ncbi:MAG: type II toxin-antitoxin system HicA family toxin [Thermodesulfobacteriota bacterium]|nr:type II toxin-antitoxin system HicA family toxin [Thermodesulfobacteriota bacterium]
MPENVPSLKAKQLIRLLESGGCKFYREGKGEKRVVPIDMGEREFSPPYVLRIFRQFGFTDEEIEGLLK